MAAELDLVKQGVDLKTPSDFKTRNLALQLNSKLGGQAELCRDLAEPGTVFISYDVSLQRGIGLAVSVTLLGHDGRVTSGPADSRPQKGEALDTEFLEKSLLESVKMYERQCDSPVRRVVVYRDGRFLKDERQVCLETLSSYKVDLVEITKSGPDCFRFIEFDKTENTSSQPLPGSYVTLRERVACLVMPSAATVPSGLARPIVVSHVHGLPRRQRSVLQVLLAPSRFQDSRAVLREVDRIYSVIDRIQCKSSGRRQGLDLALRAVLGDEVVLPYQPVRKSRCHRTRVCSIRHRRDVLP